MSIFTNPSKVLHNMLDSFTAFIQGPLWSFLKPVVLVLETEGGPILIAAAENAVAVGFTIVGGGAPAMAAAIKSFEDEIVAKGLPFIESQARALIEMALQKAKTTIPAAA